MSAATVVDGVCQFFGGPYDPGTRSYPNPVLPGVSVVRRAWPREDTGYFTNQPPGTSSGAVLVAQVAGTRDVRVALPAVQGRRFVRYAIDLHFFVASVAPMVEDCQDFVHALYDNTVALIRTDPTLGSGGIENNAFQIGEGEFGEIDSEMQQGANVSGLTKAYLRVSFEAHSYEVG